MKLSDIKQSKYLTKDDCGTNGIIVTIDRVVMENLAMENQPAEMKCVAHFVEAVKPMVVNAENFGRIVMVTGQEDSDDWQGKQITIFNDASVMFQGRQTGGIRVFVQPQQPVAPTAPQSVEQAAYQPPGPADALPRDSKDDLPF